MNVQRGSSITIECRAEGYPQPMVHWEKCKTYSNYIKCFCWNIYIPKLMLRNKTM